MPDTPPRRQSIDRIRQFNRRYVPVMRLLDRSYLDTGLSTLETDVLIEIGEHGGCTARDLSQRLSIDKGYLSRMLQRFSREGWLAKASSADDGRIQLLSLTPAGREQVGRMAVAGEGIVDAAFDHTDDEMLAQVADALGFVLDVLERKE